MSTTATSFVKDVSDKSLKTLVVQIHTSVGQTVEVRPEKASVITSKPAINDHFKTGQRSRAQNMKLFYRDGASSCKFYSVSA